MIIFIAILLLVIIILLLHIRELTSDKESYKFLYDMWSKAHFEEWKINNKPK